MAGRCLASNIIERFAGMRDFHRVCAGLLVSAMIGASMGALGADPAPGEQIKGQATKPAVPQTQYEYTADPNDYHIGPLDLLEIKVLQADNMSRTVRVDAHGNISLPL